MRLNDPLVTSFVYKEERYAIDLSFDNVLDVFDVFNDAELRDYEKAEISLVLLLGDVGIDDVIGLWDYVYKQFIHIDSKQPIKYDRKGNPLPVQKEQKQSIDFSKDGEYIYASFQQAYNINLFKVQGKMHWLEFQALLNGLPSDTIMQQIRQIRIWEPRKGESQEYKKHMRELQELYALDDESMEDDAS